MRVVFVNRFCHPDHSATSQILSDLAAGLAAQGVAVTMIASRQRYDDPAAALPRREQWRGVEIQRVWTSRFGRRRLPGRALDYLSFYCSLPWTLWRLLRRGDVVVAMTDPPLVSLLVALVARLRGAVLVNWLQDLFPEVVINLGQPKLPRPLAWLLRRLRNTSLRMAAMNVAIGERMAAYLKAQGIAADRLRVIANWAHEEWIQPMPLADSELRQLLGLQGHFVVAYFGNLGRAHDWKTLFDAGLELSSEQGIAFIVSGGGHGYEALRSRVGESGLDNFRFLPYLSLSELSDAMAAADLHLVSLLPQLEGLIVPSKFYGIAAAGRSIGFIGDVDGELARLIAGNDCGFSVATGRGDLLAHEIHSLAADADRCGAQGRCARMLLDDRFSRNRAHRQWHDLLCGIDGGSHSRMLNRA